MKGQKTPDGIYSNRIRKITKKSSTPGHTKPNCIANSLMKFCAKRNRAYRYSEYNTITKVWDSRN